MNSNGKIPDFIPKINGQPLNIHILFAKIPQISFATNIKPKKDLYINTFD